MEDSFIHSTYVFWRIGNVEIQFWPPAWWLLLIVGVVLLVAVFLAVVLIPRMIYSASAKRDERP